MAAAAADFLSLLDTVRAPLETETEIDMLVVSADAALDVGVGAFEGADVSGSVVKSTVSLTFSFCCACAFVVDPCICVFCGSGKELNLEGLEVGSSFADLLAGCCCCGSATSHFDGRFRPSAVDT